MDKKRGNNRKRAVKNVDVTVDVNIEDEPVVKKGRGQAKKKQAAQEVEAPARRGRPRKNTIDMAVKAEPEVNDAQTVELKATVSKRGGKRGIKVEEVKEENDVQKPSTSNGTRAKGTKNKSKASKKAVKEETPEEPSSGKISGAERVVVLKGRAPVDALCPIAKHSHIYDEGDDIWDCMLNQTNIQFNNNKYYLIQLLQDDSRSSYSVWMRWGRVGANGQNSLQPCGSDVEKAKKIFMKKFSDKTKNDWDMRDCFEKVPGKYDLLAMDYSKGNDTPDSDAGAVERAKEVQKKVECKLEIRVRALIELICDVRAMEATVVEMKYDAKKAPLGKLTSEQIKAGYLALKHIDDLTKTGNYKQMELVHACNDFYTRVPHYFGMKVPPLIRTRNEIQEKMALLEALGDIQAAMSFLDQAIDINIHPADQHYVGLKCDINPLEKNSDDFKVIEKYLKTTHGKTHNNYDLELVELFACKKEAEYEKFKDVGNRMLLWHGSRLSNWAGILSQGLRIAPPEAPSTGYMFGKGIYFADMASKSANYCWATKRSNIGLLLLSEVALGKINELLNADYNANKLPKGCNSVKGCGQTVPALKNFTTLSDGTLVPMGPSERTEVKNSKGFTLMYNEYIVYDPAQVRTRFLLKIKFNFKY